MMTQILEVAQFVDENGMPQVQIRRRRVETRFYSQRPTGFELLNQFGLDQNSSAPRLISSRLSARTSMVALQNEPVLARPGICYTAAIFLLPQTSDDI